MISTLRINIVWLDLWGIMAPDKMLLQPNILLNFFIIPAGNMGVLIRSDFMGTNYISFDGEIKENIFIFPIPPLIWSY